MVRDPSEETSNLWEKLDPGSLKINVHNYFDLQYNKVGIRVIVRDEMGTLKKGLGRC